MVLYRFNYTSGGSLCFYDFKTGDTGLICQTELSGKVVMEEEYAFYIDSESILYDEIIQHSTEFEHIKWKLVLSNLYKSSQWKWNSQDRSYQQEYITIQNCIRNSFTTMMFLKETYYEHKTELFSVYNLLDNN